MVSLSSFLIKHHSGESVDIVFEIEMMFNDDSRSYGRCYITLVCQSRWCTW